MEHRRSSRTSLRQHVGLDSPRTGSFSAYTHDLSLGGMFIEIASLALPPNTPVKVSFTLPGNAHGRVFVLEASVVRRGSNGLGLMFLQMEQDQIRALSGALAELHEPGALK